MLVAGDDCFADYPCQVYADSAHPASEYRRVAGYYAVHHRPVGAPAPGAVMVLNDGAIAVFRGDPDDAVGTAQTLTPVYRLEPAGPLAVPTGLVWIRFAETVIAETRGAAITALGYQVVEVPTYAPFAAWLRAASGNVAEALTGLARLAALPGVESVAPQMLMERKGRASAPVSLRV